MADPAFEQPAVAPARKTGWFSWLILFAVGTAAISLIAVYLPSRVKMLGLFAIGQGLVAGCLAAWLASKFDLRTAARRLGSAIVFVVILGGQVGTAFESYRVYRAEKERALAANPKQAAALRMLQSLNLPDDANSRKRMAELRETIGANGTSFAAYLQFRVSDLKIRSRRWATVFWISEAVLGSLAGTWIFRRMAPAARLDASEPPAKLDE